MPAQDDSALLPSPPLPRPAARDAAIAAAMRRFDGLEDKPTASASRPLHWTRKPQFGMLVTASLVAVLGIPAALIALRSDDLRPRPQASAPAPLAPPVHQNKLAPTPQTEAAAPATRLTEEPSVAPPAHHRDVAVTDGSRKRETVAVGSNEVSTDATEPRAMVAAPAVAFAPPPPPPAPALAQSGAGQVADQVVVTGSLMRAPSMEKSRKAARAEDSFAPTAPDWVLKDRSYAAFLTSLQAAVRGNDRNAVIDLVAFPLRVNSNGRSRVYRDAESVRRDYDRIFTARVTRAILNQRFDRLFGRDQGLMIGDGQVWFDHVSPSGPVRIRAINP